MTYQKSYKQLFAFIPEQNISSEIETRVMIRIEHSRTIQARVYFLLHMSIIFVAIGICIPVVHSFIVSASQSGFDSYVSLLSSDGLYVLSSWRDLGLSIIESIPIIETTTFIGLILVIGNSLRRSTYYLPALHERSHMTLIS